MVARKITINDFKDILNKLILPSDKALVLYSGLWTIGHQFEIGSDCLPDAILDALEEVVGPERTLLIPTHTNCFTHTREFDVFNSKPETGILGERFLRRGGVRRTLSALDSFAVKGPHAELLVTMMGETLWGRGSVYEWMERENVRVGVLGSPTGQRWNWCGMLHRIEEVAQVPYRYYKAFRGRVRYYDEEWKPWMEIMFVRPLGVRLQFRWNRVEDKMRDANQILSSSNSAIYFETAYAKDIIVAGVSLLKTNPYALLANQEEVADWVKNGKAVEINNLKKEGCDPCFGYYI